MDRNDLEPNNRLQQNLDRLQVLLCRNNDKALNGNGH